MFAKKLLTIRKEKNLSQKQLAKLLNVSDKTVSHWERGRSTPDIYTLKLIADILQVDVNYFYEDNIDESATSQQNNQILDSQILSSLNKILFIFKIFCIVCIAVQAVNVFSGNASSFLYLLNLILFAVGICYFAVISSRSRQFYLNNINFQKTFSKTELLYGFTLAFQSFMTIALYQINYFGYIALSEVLNNNYCAFIFNLITPFMFSFWLVWLIEIFALKKYNQLNLKQFKQPLLVFTVLFAMVFAVSLNTLFSIYFISISIVRSSVALSLSILIVCMCFNVFSSVNKITKQLLRVLLSLYLLYCIATLCSVFFTTNLSANKYYNLAMDIFEYLLAIVALISAILLCVKHKQFKLLTILLFLKIAMFALTKLFNIFLVECLTDMDKLYFLQNFVRVAVDCACMIIIAILLLLDIKKDIFKIKSQEV